MSLLFSFEMVKIVYFIEQAVESQVMPQSAMRFFLYGFTFLATFLPMFHGLCVCWSQV